MSTIIEKQTFSKYLVKDLIWMEDLVSDARLTSKLYHRNIQTHLLGLTNQGHIF